VRYLPGNAQHIGSREDQQDSFGFSRLDEPSAASQGAFVAAIADGMGGLANGREASQAAIKAFLASYAEKPGNETIPAEAIPAALQRSLLAANDAVVEAGERLGQRGDVGSTFVAAAFFNQLLYWVSVGDSALYLLRGGRLTLLNSFHIHGNDLDRGVSEGAISREEAAAHPDREALTSYLGQDPPAEIELTVRPFRLQDGDQVILATDGIFKTLTEEEMNRATDASPQRTCEQLVRYALEANKEYQDNLTVVAVSYDAEAKPVAVAEQAEAEAAPPALDADDAHAAHVGYARRSRYAVAALCIALLCAAIVFALLARRRHGRRSAPRAETVTAEPAQSVPPPDANQPDAGKRNKDGPSAKTSPTANANKAAKPAPKDDLKF